MTIPKNLAAKAGIKPGDSVVFEDAGDDQIVLKRAGSSSNNSSDVKSAIESFVKDVPRIKKQLKESESALIENLSRHLSSK